MTGDRCKQASAVIALLVLLVAMLRGAPAFNMRQPKGNSAADSSSPVVWIPDGESRWEVKTRAEGRMSDAPPITACASVVSGRTRRK